MTTDSSSPNPSAAAPSGQVDIEKRLLGGGTYRSLGEQRLSPAEERFERRRRTLGLFLAPLATIAIFVIPFDLEQSQHTLAALLLGVMILWITEPVPIPVAGLMGVALLVMLDVAPSDEVLAPFGSGTVFTFIGAFILAQAMLKHGLARRFAFRILSVRGVGHSTTRVVIAFGVITCVISAFISNTATVAMLIPTALGILAVIAGLIQDQRGADETEGFDPPGCGSALRSC